MINVYLSLVAGTVFNSLQRLIESPFSIVALFGSSVPSVSVFFINVLLAKWLVGLSTMLIRIWSWVLITFYTYCRNESKLTVRELIEGPFALSYFDFGQGIPEILYVTVIVMLYWVIAPLVSGIGTLYFLSLYIVLKYQFLYVYVPKFHAGGFCFYKLYDYTMTGLLASSIAILGFMGIKEGISQSPLLFPLPLFILFMWRYTEGKFKILSLNLSYTRAVAIDKEFNVSESSSDSSEQSKQERAVPFPNINVPQRSDNTYNLMSHQYPRDDYLSLTTPLHPLAPAYYAFQQHLIFYDSTASKRQLSPQFYFQPALQPTQCNAIILPYRYNQESLFVNKKRFNPIYYNMLEHYKRIVTDYEGAGDILRERNSLIPEAASLAGGSRHSGSELASVNNNSTNSEVSAP